MILQKLCEYYDRIDADPTQTIAQKGFAPQKISFAVVINEDGSLHEIQDVRDASGKKPVPQLMRLPFEKRTSGIKAMFLWDKAEYLLGYVPPEIANATDSESDAARKNRAKKVDRILSCHSATVDLHLAFKNQVEDKNYQLLCKFFETWQSTYLTESQKGLLEEVGTGFGVFRIQGTTRFLHDSPELRQLWIKTICQATDKEVNGVCLVSGEAGSLARLHPVIKGVRDAQTSGASIVSFNDDAFTSYGKKQSFNAPVSENAAFKYATALNCLLQKDSGRKLQIGDTTCVFWADKPTVVEDLFAFGLDSESQFEDAGRAAEIETMLLRARDGIADYPDAGVGFQVLGLSPNASRLSIRFWMSETAETLVNRIARHQKRLEIAKGPKDRDLIPLWLVLAQTARESKEIQPLLGGALLRSVLTDSRYPESMLAAVIRRIRAEQDIRHVKAATIKAILIRNYQKEISVMLDPQRSEGSYQLGRLFACLERAQEDALPGLNATIKDRYFGAASSTPSTVFPRLIRLSQHHVGKLDGGKKVVAEKRLQEIMGRLSGFPSHLNLEDQGLFAIGYYHQRQDFFKKKKKSDHERDQSMSGD
ncbi:MAG: type I-C CRISPR-associated protein Cas8c/Csd1 [Planctomycetota bacterium]